MKTRTSRWRLARHLISVMLAAASCRESTTPDGGSTRLSPASATQLTGTVGTSVADAPAVTVRDARGRPVAGVAVTFSVQRGDGSIQTPRVVSSSDGIARVGSWTLGTVPGMNVIAATSTSGDTVVFTADAVQGPPAHLEKYDGDGQIAPPGATLGIRPKVRLSDAYDNGIPGVMVTFAVEAGGGSMSAGVAVTNSAGIAESGEWVLGQAGVQRLVARVGQLVSEPFTARAVVPPVGCASSDALALQTTFRSALTAGSCAGPDGRLLETYTIVVTEPNGYLFTATSGEFDTSLELRGADLVELARSKAMTTGSAIKALLPPGTYILTVSSSRLGGSGSYSVSYQRASVSADGCEEAFIVRGITARGIVQGYDCVSPNQYWDQFRIYLASGSRVEIRMTDFSYSGPNVRLVAPDGSDAWGSWGPEYLTLVYTAPGDGYYTLLIGLLNEIGIVYEITVQ